MIGKLDDKSHVSIGLPDPDPIAELGSQTSQAALPSRQKSDAPDRLESGGAPVLALPAARGAPAGHPQLQVQAADPKPAVEKQYGDWARNYDHDTASYGWSAPARLLDVTTRLVPPRSPLRVLDVGVGTGLASVPYLASGAQVTGLDIAQEMLDQAKEKHPGFHHLDRYNIDQPLSTAGVKPGTMDLVISSGTLHFAKNLQGTLRELSAALAPGGTLAFTFIPPQGRKFGASTSLHSPAKVVRFLATLGLKTELHQKFIAYHDKGDASDPVRYAMIVAKKAGTAPAEPEGLETLDRTACVDRARVRKLALTPLLEGPQQTHWVSANDPAYRAELKALSSSYFEPLAAGAELNPATLPLPTRTASVAREGKPGCDALVLLAHPDDETVYTGGTIGKLTAGGKKLTLAVATDGGGGRGGAASELVAKRRAEQTAAVQQLGISGEGHGLGFGDIGKYRDTHRSEPLTASDTLRAWGPEKVLESMVRQIRTERPRALMTFDPTRDPNYSLHGHHLAVGVAATLAYHLAADPEAFPEQGLRPWAIEQQLTVVPDQAKGGRQQVVEFDPATKRAALLFHASQIFSLERLLENPSRLETWNRFESRVAPKSSNELLEAAR